MMGGRGGGGGRGGRAGGGGGKLEAKVPEGTRIRWSSNLGPEARAEANNDVLVGPKFFDLDKETQANVLAHEYGHVLEQETGSLRAGSNFDQAMDVLGRPVPRGYRDAGHQWYGFGATTSVTESFAEAYMSYIRNPSGLQSQTPAVYRYMRNIVRKEPAFGRIDFDAIAGQLEPGPAGGRTTIFEEH